MKLFITLAAVFAIAAVAAWPYLPAADWVWYFDFADKRALLTGIPNTLDMLSNAGFLFAGLYGLRQLWLTGKRLPTIFRVMFAALALSAVLTAFGSSYFHWHPTPQTLSWDRLPMTLGFCAIVSMLCADRFNETAGWAAAAVLFPLGLWSVTGHHFGLITLKPYIALQFGTILFVAVILWLRPAGLLPNSRFWKAAFWYVLAKILEMADKPVFAWSDGVVSGHTLKHVSATFTLWILLTWPAEFRLRQQRRVQV